MNLTTISLGAVTALILCAGSFYGGTLYSKSTAVPAVPSFEAMGDRQIGSGFANGARPNSGTMTIGTILSIDEESATISLPDGGSKIIFFSDETEVLTTKNGSVADLTVGTTVSTSGTTNDDGSVSAASIQVRPEMQLPPTL